MPPIILKLLPYIAALAICAAAYTVGHIKGTASCEIKSATQTENTIINAEEAKNAIRNNPPDITSLSHRLHAGTW